MRANVRPDVYITALRGNLEYGVAVALPWVPGEVETLLVRIRNVSDSRLDAVGAITINANGHVLAPVVEIGEGSLDAEGRFVGPTQIMSAPMPAGVAGTDLVYNVRVPWGMFVELRVQCTWGDTDVPPTASYGPEVLAAPVYRASSGPAGGGIPALGFVPPTAPPATP